MTKKRRTLIPAEVAAEILFASDRTCCMCTIPGLQTQIHHIDGDPTNHNATNLAVLCLQHHALTEIHGGFGRRLDAAQVIKYRDNWHQRVLTRRSRADELAIALATGQAPQQNNPTSQASPRPFPPVAFIASLPHLRKGAADRAREGWAGATNQIRQATYEYIQLIESVLVTLASYYPADQFGKPSREYFSEYIAARYFWHRAHLEPEGRDTGGSIIHVQTAVAVMHDVDEMVLELVRSLADSHPDFDLEQWLTAWQAVEIPEL